VSCGPRASDKRKIGAKGSWIQTQGLQVPVVCGSCFRSSLKLRFLLNRRSTALRRNYRSRVPGLRNESPVSNAASGLSRRATASPDRFADGRRASPCRRRSSHAESVRSGGRESARRTLTVFVRERHRVCKQFIGPDAGGVVKVPLSLRKRRAHIIPQLEFQRV
jgi:hypothetical protein